MSYLLFPKRPFFFLRFSFLYTLMTVRKDFPEMYLFIHYCLNFLSYPVDSTLFVPTPSVVNPDSHTTHTFHCMCHQLQGKRKQHTLFILQCARNTTPWAYWMILLLLLCFFFFSNFILNFLITYRYYRASASWSHIWMSSFKYAALTENLEIMRATTLKITPPFPKYI